MNLTALVKIGQTNTKQEIWQSKRCKSRKQGSGLQKATQNLIGQNGGTYARNVVNLHCEIDMDKKCYLITARIADAEWSVRKNDNQMVLPIQRNNVFTGNRIWILHSDSVY